MGNTASEHKDKVSDKNGSSTPKHRKSVSSTDEKRGSQQKRSTGSATNSARVSMSQQGNRKPLLTSNQRMIVKYCMDNAKDDLGERIMRRVVEKKQDYRAFIDNLPRDQRKEVAEVLKNFLQSISENLMDSDELQKRSEGFGAQHVPFRSQGFKPDFFASTADAVTTECSFLDMATHGASDTVSAWSQLSSFVFSAVRDGYYAELRKQRKSSSAFKQRASVDISEGSAPSERRSPTPGQTDEEEVEQPKEEQSLPTNGNFLLPPTVN